MKFLNNMEFGKRFLLAKKFTYVYHCKIKLHSVADFRPVDSLEFQAVIVPSTLIELVKHTQLSLITSLTTMMEAHSSETRSTNPEQMPQSETLLQQILT